MFSLCGLIYQTNILTGLLYKTKGMIFGLIYCSILYFGLLYRTITGDKWTCIEVHKIPTTSRCFVLIIRASYPIMCKEPFRIRKKSRKIFFTFFIFKNTLRRIFSVKWTIPHLTSFRASEGSF